MPCSCREGEGSENSEAAAPSVTGMRFHLKAQRSETEAVSNTLNPAVTHVSYLKSVQRVNIIQNKYTRCWMMLSPNFLPLQ